MKFKRIISLILILIMGCLSMCLCSSCSEEKIAVLYQVTPDDTMLMNCYIIKTKNDKLIVIDGGGAGSVSQNGYLYEELQRISGKDVPEIEAWFFSHMHDDHVNEFCLIGNDYKKDIIINNIYFNFPSKEFMEKTEEGKYAKYYEKIGSAYDRFKGTGSFEKLNGKNVYEGDVIEIDDVKFEILLTCTDEETENNINDTSMIFKTTIGEQTIMFLGDAYINEGKRLLEKYGNSLECDIVQMAHHGQSGVEKDVYEAISPKLCMWPAPKWVFNNVPGILKSFEVRQWMTDMGVKNHMITGLYGTQELHFPVDFDELEEVSVAP